MKPEQQRIKIAEACGFSNPYHRTFVIGPDILADGETGDPIPDYLNDLNAMHTAENARIDEGNYDTYTYWLDRIDEGTTGDGAYCATAAQRAEAFLKTLGLWEETL